MTLCVRVRHYTHIVCGAACRHYTHIVCGAACRHYTHILCVARHAVHAGNRRSIVGASAYAATVLDQRVGDTVALWLDRAIDSLHCYEL